MRKKVLEWKKIKQNEKDNENLLAMEMHISWGGIFLPTQVTILKRQKLR